MAARLRLAVPLLALVLATAAAQPTLPPPGPVPSPQGEAGVEVRAMSSSLTVSLDRAAQVEVDVRHTGTPSGTPLDQPRLVTLAVSGLPEGWHASAPQPAEFHLRPGQSGKAKITVAVSGDAQQEKVALTVTARMYASGVGEVPVAGPQADPESTAATVVQARRADSVTRNVLENVGPYIWVLILGLAAALVLAFSLLAANRRIAVRLSTPGAEQAIPPGGRGTFPLRVHNITRQADTVFLRTAPLPEGWSAYLPTPQVDLEPGQQEEVAVVVIPPKEAGAGVRQPVDVTATSALAPRRPATVRFEARIGDARRKA